MRKLAPFVIPALLAIALVAVLGPWGPNSAEQDLDAGGKKRRVLIVGIDGVRPDALKAATTPVIDQFIADGAVSYDALAGGTLGEPTEQPTVSGPGWASIFTGVWINKHKIRDNDFRIHNLGKYPHFFQRVKEKKPNAVLASIVSWGPIEDHIVLPVAASLDLHLKAEGKDYKEKDRWVIDQAVAYLGSADPDVLALHLDQVDGAGHDSGFRLENSNYLEAIAAVDGQIGEVWQAIQARPNFANEDWLTIITTDHGGIDKSHGGKTVEEKTIFFIASGGGVQKKEVAPGPGHTAVPPTAMRHLGIPIDPAWGWSSRSFGY